MDNKFKEIVNIVDHLYTTIVVHWVESISNNCEEQYLSDLENLVSDYGKMPTVKTFGEYFYDKNRPNTPEEIVPKILQITESLRNDILEQWLDCIRCKTEDDFLKTFEDVIQDFGTELTKEMFKQYKEKGGK